METTAQNGWAELNNGNLLDAAEAAGFEVFLTVDGNLSYQQNLSGRSIRLVVLEAANNRTLTLAPLVPHTLELMTTLAPGAVCFVQATPEQEREAMEAAAERRHSKQGRDLDIM